MILLGMVVPARDRLRAAGRRRPARGRRADPAPACCTVEQSYRSIDWTTVILVGAMMPLSTAMEQTGAAKLMADGARAASSGTPGPYALLAGLFMLTAIMGQLISNTATA